MEMIPDKVEFRRIEVEKITSLSGKVLDYWEGEFTAFSPKNKSGEKIYLHQDVLIILKIKQYLTVERLNKAEIKEKLSKKINSVNVLIKKKSEIKENLTVISSENKKFPLPTDPTPITNEIKQQSRAEDPKEKKKPNKNNESKLNIIKQDLQEILTILGNNDKKSI